MLYIMYNRRYACYGVVYFVHYRIKFYRRTVPDRKLIRVIRMKLVTHSCLAGKFIFEVYGFILTSTISVCEVVNNYYDEIKMDVFPYLFLSVNLLTIKT